MKRRLKKRLLTSITALAVTILTFAGRTPIVYAATIDSSVVEEMQNTDEVQRLRSEIDDLISKNDKTRAAYKTDYWGAVTFTDSHRGGWHTIYGHQARIAVAFKPTDGNTALSGSLALNGPTYHAWPVRYYYNSVDSDGYYMYVSDWTTVTYQGAYQMIYDFYTTGSGGVHSGRRVSCHVWIDYM